MARIAFKMQLFKGFEEEYKKRHDAIWDELKTLFHEKGVSNFSIFLDEETGILFACLDVEDIGQLNDLPGHPVQKKWWKYMKDIMETNPDNSPVQVKLKEVFHLA